jgi:nucleoside-diphosphate-sugar epimerase
MSSFYKNKKVFIAGGAGFIGSHLLDQLLAQGAQVTVGDNLSTGSDKNLRRIWKKHGLKHAKTGKGYKVEGGHNFIWTDFEDFSATMKALKNQEIVFHLAANIGGRGYIDTHPADCCEGFSINENVIKASHLNNVDRVMFASSACVYPEDLQDEYGSEYLLKEEDAFRDNWGNADKEYGWAKLMGEMTLKAYYTQYGLKGACARYVTAYGPWENDTHAIIALIRRAVEKQEPYTIWGSGKQDRDFTYVDDIVNGTMLACEHITNAEAVNLGTGKRYTMQESVDLIFDILGWQPSEIFYDTSKPQGVKTRALDIQKARQLIGYEPTFDLRMGLEKTIEWFKKEKPKSVEEIR